MAFDFILVFFVVMFSSLLGPSFFQRFGIPYSTALIITGFFLGPYMFQAVGGDSELYTLQSLATVGILFIMFSAGLELKYEVLKKMGGSAIFIAIVNGAIPFLTGLWIGKYLGLDTNSALIIATIYVSSSIGIIVPVLKESGLLKKTIGKNIIASIVLEDIASLIILTIILQVVLKTGNIPISLYFVIIMLFVLSVIYFVPKVAKKYFSLYSGKDMFEVKIRFVFITLLLITILSEFLHLHLIISAFIVGLAFVPVIDSELEDKINTVAYSFFIPVFFIVIGLEIDPFVIFRASESLKSALLITTGLIISKFLSGSLAALLSGYGLFESCIFGAATVPQMSTTLAVAQLGHQYNIFDTVILTSIVFLSIISTILSPLMINYFVGKKIEFEVFLNKYRH